MRRFLRTTGIALALGMAACGSTPRVAPNIAAAQLEPTLDLGERGRTALRAPLAMRGGQRTWPRDPGAGIVDEDCRGGSCSHPDSSYFFRGPLPDGLESVVVHLGPRGQVTFVLAQCARRSFDEALGISRGRLGSPHCTTPNGLAIWNDGRTAIRLVDRGLDPSVSFVDLEAVRQREARESAAAADRLADVRRVSDALATRPAWRSKDIGNRPSGHLSATDSATCQPL